MFWKIKNIMWQVLNDKIDDSPIKIDFIKILWKNSEDFKKLEELVELSNWWITWEKVKKYTVIKNKKVEWIFYFDKINIKSSKLKSLRKIKKASIIYASYSLLEDLWELEEVDEINIEWTKVKSLWKLKKADKINAFRSQLKDLWKLTELKELNAIDSNLESLWQLTQADQIDLYNSNIKYVWKLKKVNKLDIKSTDIDFQININSLLKKWELEAKSVEFWWNELSVIKLLNLEKIYWILDLFNARKNIQLIAYAKVSKNILKCNHLVLWPDFDEKLNLYTDEKLDFIKFENMFWKDINKINDEDYKKWAIFILETELNCKKEEIQKNILWILKNENLNDEEKKEKIRFLNNEYLKFKEKIKKYWIKI